MKKKVIALTLAAVTALTALAGCSGSGGESSADTGSSPETKVSADVSNDDTITVAVNDELNVVDPIHGYTHEADAILMQVAEGLFYFGSDNSVQPLIAESYTQPDNTTYVYKIRDNVTFSDGNKLTADDVVFSLERHRDTSNPSELAWMFDNVDTIEKTNDLEVTVKLKTPDPMWQDSLATSAGLVIEKSYFEEHKEDFGTSSGGIIGSGPYVITEWKPGEQLELTVNDDYWDKNTTLDFKKLIFKTVSDESVIKNALEAGQIDLTFRLSVENAKEAEKFDNVNIQTVDTFSAHFISFNMSKKPFDDINVRKAVAYAIDKKTLTQNLFGNEYGKAGESLPFDRTIVSTDDPNWNSYFDNIEKYDYDLEKAKEYLAKSSVPNGFEATLIYDLSSSVTESVVLSIQQDLAKLNINIKLEGTTWSEIATQRYGGSEVRDYDLMFTGWGTDYPDPIGVILPMFASTNNVAGGSNWFEYSNKDFDRLMSEQAKASTEAERAEKLRQSLDILADEIPDVPIYYPYVVVAKNKKIDYEFSNMLLYNVFFKDFKKANA